MTKNRQIAAIAAARLTGCHRPAEARQPKPQKRGEDLANMADRYGARSRRRVGLGGYGRSLKHSMEDVLFGDSA